MNQYSAKTEKAEKAKIERINKVVRDNAPDFEYVGGYTNQQGTVLLRCKKCGRIQTNAWITVRHGHLRGTGIICEGCRAIEKEARANAKEQKRAEREALIQQRRQRMIPQQAEMIVKTCKECGASFIAVKAKAVYCCEECRKRALNNHHDRRLKGKVKDWDITLEKLYKKERGVCYLCGGLCDWTDIEDRDGVKIAGDLYPSIEHVQPLAHEGKHEWGNVRLAHRRCNYLKRDNPPVAI